MDKKTAVLLFTYPGLVVLLHTPHSAAAAADLEGRAGGWRADAAAPLPPAPRHPVQRCLSTPHHIFLIVRRNWTHHSCPTLSEITSPCDFGPIRDAGGAVAPPSAGNHQ